MYISIFYFAKGDYFSCPLWHQISLFRDMFKYLDIDKFEVYVSTIYNEYKIFYYNNSIGLTLLFQKIMLFIYM